nr:hypothetical protein [Tanacetum cinerariifolium]
MENANPPPTNNHPVLSAALCVEIDRELHIQLISAFVDSHLESIEQSLNNFANQPNETDMSNLESNDESVDTPFVSPFPHSDNVSSNGEVLNELSKKFTAYVDPFLPLNIISRKAYNTIIAEGLESTWKNLVAVVRDVYACVGVTPTRMVWKFGIASNANHVYEFYVHSRKSEVELEELETLFLAFKGEYTSNLVFVTTGIVSKDLDFTVLELVNKALLTVEFTFNSILQDIYHDSGIWKTFGVNTRDLDSIWEETDMEANGCED